MTKITLNLLTQKEQLDLYALPILSSEERTEYFTLSQKEVKALRRFNNIDEAIYFAISLVFFKLKHTFVEFSYRQVTNERQHVMQRYFPNKSSPLSLPSKHHVIIRIENTILSVTGYQRCQTQAYQSLTKKLLSVASRYPKQRALCKALLSLFASQKIAIPGQTTLHTIVRDTWNTEQRRVLKNYKRNTIKSQRQQVLSLLEKKEQLHVIIELRKEMKSFATAEITKTLEKHTVIASIFHIVKEVIPKLKLPSNTIHYYASLVNYYKGSHLKNLDIEMVQIYLLCYCFTRFQIMNDQLLEAFKKRALDYKNKGDKQAESNVATSLNDLQKLHQDLSNMLLAIHGTQNKKNIPKETIFQYIPEPELVSS